MDNHPERVRLEGQAAIDLWLKGRDGWNKWVKEHPEADVSFAEVSFVHYRAKHRKIEFNGYKFPKGDVSFHSANFGDGPVHFQGTSFGDGRVNFNKANFGSEQVSFTGATFGTGEIRFDSADFGDGLVSFQNTHFGNGNTFFRGANFGNGSTFFRGAIFGSGDVSFGSTNFGDGGAYFEKVKFGNGGVSFGGAIFGSGQVRFDNANFGDGPINFKSVRFGDGDVVKFDGAIFGKGNVDFERASFGDVRIYFVDVIFWGDEISFRDVSFGSDSLSFEGTSFGSGTVDFENAIFRGHVNLSNLGKSQNLKEFSLKNASFEKSLNLSENSFNCVIDLMNTKLAHQVSLEGLRCVPKTNWYGRAEDINDSSKLRRLKEIEEGNRNHQQALGFHAAEMRAKRWHETKFLRGLELDLLFDCLSDYGQSIWRPVVMLVLVIGLFGWVYNSSSPACVPNNTIGDSLLFSAIHALPFIPSNREASQKGINKLHDCDESLSLVDSTYKWVYLQNIISFILIFLIGLGFRNRFRI